MTNENKNNKIITAILALVIIIALITFLYINLPEEKNNNDNTGGTNNETVEEPETILTITFGEIQMDYTLEQIASLESYTSTATMIKTGWLPTVKLEGPNQYIGVKISTLLNQIDNLPENYSINVTDINNEITDYNMSQIQGNVDIYNESGIIIGNSGATMILAYKIDGEYFTEEDTGPLRIVFCHENNTASNLWLKMVRYIEIIEN